MKAIKIFSALVASLMCSTAVSSSLGCSATVGTHGDMPVDQELTMGNPTYNYQINQYMAICSAVSDVRIKSGTNTYTLKKNSETIVRGYTIANPPVYGAMGCANQYYIGHSIIHIAYNELKAIRINIVTYSTDATATGLARLYAVLHSPTWGSASGFRHEPSIYVDRPTTTASRKMTFNSSQVINMDAGTSVSYKIAGNVSSDAGMPDQPTASVRYKIRAAGNDGLRAVFDNGLDEITTTNWSFPTLLLTTAGSTGTGTYGRIVDATITCP